MEKGQLIGTLMPVQLSPVTAIKIDGVHILQALSGSDSSRVSELLKQLDISDELSTVERKKVHEVIGEFSDVFALTPAELGHTELVQHTINTGDHSPIKQLPHRTPFALRRQTEEMIAKMLEQGGS